MLAKTARRILPVSEEFITFWKENGPFRYALSSREFPPVLLEPEEWIFSNDMTELLKELMQWKPGKMKIVQAAFNRKKTDVLKPDALSPWRISNFPEEWEQSICSSFTPKGFLTESVELLSSSDNKEAIEKAFFQSLENDIETIGYILLKPEPLISGDDSAFIDDYLKEWIEDESED